MSTKNLTAYSFKEPTIEKYYMHIFLVFVVISCINVIIALSVFFLFFVFFGEKSSEGREEGFCFRILHVGTLSCGPTRGASSVWTTRTWVLLGWDFDLT